MAQNTHILPVNLGDGNVHSGNIAGSFDTSFYKSDEDAQIMRWLSPLEPNNRHQGVRTDRFDGIGDWLLETREFREWRGGEGGADKAVLFCSGNPGVGKTYLSSLVIDTLSDQAGKEDIAVAVLYCDFLSQQEQTISNILGAILKQLVGRGGGIPKDLREAFQKTKQEVGGRGPRLVDLMGMLRVAIASLPRVYICIDALDECLPKYLPELLKSLRDIARESPRMRIFLTGRPYFGEDVQRYFSRAVMIPISPNRDDIQNYLEMRLEGDPEPEAMNDGLRVDIVRVIMENISDIFLLVSLNIDAILGAVTIRQRRKKLDEMAQGSGLGDAYTATLGRLRAQKRHKSVLGLKVLMWVSYSERPLRAEELCHALGVEIGSGDLDAENVPALRTLVASCLGLVTIEASSSTVRLVHFTLQEHLSRDPTLFHSPHSAIAEVCLTYLNFVSIRNYPPTLSRAPATTPLLEYASLYWGKHTKRGMTEDIKILALRLLDRFDEHISAQLLLLHYNQDRGGTPSFDGAEGPMGFTGLHGIAFLGIAEMVSPLLDIREWDVNVRDCRGMTAFAWASRRGHEDIVKVLLEREDVNPNQADTKYNSTPLLWAARNGHEGVVKTLLEQKDVDPDPVDSSGRTPLSWAAGIGCEGAVKALLDLKNVNPDPVDSNGRTPLSWAAGIGCEGAVKALLEQEGVNPDAVDSYGRTPLSWAAGIGCEGAVKALLELKNVNPDPVDSSGRTPLSWAAGIGCEGAVKALLERDGVDPDPADSSGRTPLSWAAGGRCEGVVKVLLERKGVNPDPVDSSGRTPLSWAAGIGCVGAVKALLERKDVNPNLVDSDGRAPLSWAAKYGCEGVVKALLERKDINPDPMDSSGRTPLLWAAEIGCEGAIKALSKRTDVNPNLVDSDGRAPLSWAAKHGCEGAVKALLERKDINPNPVDSSGRTPLLWTAEIGCEGAVKALLKRKDVNPNLADSSDRTPLSWAAGIGCKGAVKALLGREDVNPDLPDSSGRRPFLWAVSGRHEQVAKLFLERRYFVPDPAPPVSLRIVIDLVDTCGAGGAQPSRV